MAVMAMFTKEITITLPLMILLYEFSFLRTKKSLTGKPYPFLTYLIYYSFNNVFYQIRIPRDATMS